MTIKAKFASQCPKCRNMIQAGDRVSWTPGSKATHVVCNPASVENVVVENQIATEKFGSAACFDQPVKVINSAPSYQCEHGKSNHCPSLTDQDMYLSEQGMDRDDASYMAWIQFQAISAGDFRGTFVYREDYEKPVARIAVEDSGVYVMPNGDIVKVQANREKTRTYAKRWVVTNSDRLNADGSHVKGEYVYEAGLVQQVAEQGRKMSLEEAKAFILQYGQCVRCGRKLKDGKSVEAGIGPVCVKYFSTGTTGAALLVGAA